MSIQKIIRSIYLRMLRSYESEFGRRVLILMTGTTIAQAIPVAISPILTRIYSPESFGILTLFISVAAIVSAISNLRFHLAIVQPSADEDAASLVILSIIIAAIVSLFSLVTVHFWNQDISDYLGNEALGPWLYFVPVSVLFFGMYQALNYWLTRREDFNSIASSKVAQGLSMGTAQVAVGALGHGPLGLVIGYVFGQLNALLVLLRPSLNHRKKIKNISAKDVINNGGRFKRLPLYSAPGALLNSATIQLPNLFIARYFDLVSIGFFGLVLRVVNLPLALISGAVGQAALQRLAVYENNDEKKNFARVFILKLSLMLLFLITPFSLFIMVYGEVLFSFFFGEAWGVAGDMAGVLVFAVAIKFIVSPLSVVMVLERNARAGMAWQVIYFCTLFFTLTFFNDLALKAFLKVYVVHEVALYLLYFILILKSVGKSGSVREHASTD